MIDDYLKELGEQNVHEEKIEVVSNPVVEELCSCFEKLLDFTNDLGVVWSNYEKIKEFIKDVKYTSKDITKFVFFLEQYKDRDKFSYKSGAFLSALINESNEDNFDIYTNHLQQAKIDFFGYKNKKNVVVRGNLNDHVGFGMLKGEIKIEGDVENNLCDNMKGGKIVISGNANHFIGQQMTDGVIIVEGSAQGWVGRWSKGGEIRIGKEIDCIGDGCKAKVYENGVLIDGFE